MVIIWLPKCFAKSAVAGTFKDVRFLGASSPAAVAHYMEMARQVVDKQYKMQARREMHRKRDARKIKK